ncbi:monofunctional biosynthetic peptidoglycan transglycosylase [Pelagovum pacificum]|uniref:Biosynthetic peptidoglycan transglycosylase n=1 Tax=Pelagovum pacificum TaxID=2588711 RepID=A0A5C5GGX8_9RHOB|nr:monofunctional biosynthetic peptidoglycan transglycosylase [Pelagovum pacificum]QQA42846.1 monofunctional biosynthetic peptidoglycan transglycosylase [Pelagovum pacificum]TNY34005.1 monofunctional biosynthetic peptidoglycan transglycosylase [Pelagovum pacificum]
MARRARSKSTKASGKTRTLGPIRWLRRWVLRFLGVLVLLTLLLVSLFAFMNPPTTPYMLTERTRLGTLEREWVDLSEVSPVMARAVVAAEDANFCNHWGLDLQAIRAAIASGGDRGGSTISQQTVKNVYLWHGRNYTRKAIEALVTPVVEAIWSKQRIIEVYLNVAEFDEGVFGVEAAAQHYFGIPASQLSPMQAGLLAAILPSPKTRSASNPTSDIRQRAQQILDGAATIERDGRAACFQVGNG